MYNEVIATQRRDYSGLLYKKITPTDIDGFFEIRNQVFVFFELKGHNAKAAKGQMLALERLVDIIPKPALLVYATHRHAECEMIVAADAIVSKYRSNRQWHDGQRRTMKYIIDAFLRKNGLGEYV